MRFVSALLFVALTSSLASADDAKPAEPKPEARQKVPLRLVRVLAETHQALLFDKTKNTHVLAEVGETVEGYALTDIDDDEVFLDAPNGAEVVLAAPAWHQRAQEPAPAPKAEAKPAEAKPAEAKPADPYADATAPQDPYADPSPSPSPSPDPAPAAAPVAAPAPAPVAAPAPAPAPVAAPAPDPEAPIALSRADVNATLSNFAKLSSQLHATFTPAGARVDAIADTSIFFRAGLRAGDVITAVDNQPLHSLDDAATLYARASTTRNATVHVLRADKPISLHIAIQ